MQKSWALLDQFVPDPLSGYDPISVDLWVMKYGFILDNLYCKEITLAETRFRRIEIDYDENSKFTAIRVYCHPEDIKQQKRVYGLK
jgi:hypothetical protein